MSSISRQIRGRPAARPGSDEWRRRLTEYRCRPEKTATGIREKNAAVTQYFFDVGICRLKMRSTGRARMMASVNISNAVTILHRKYYSGRVSLAKIKYAVAFLGNSTGFGHLFWLPFVS